MKTSSITIKSREHNSLFKEVYINGECVGVVMADETMSAKECYESLKNNWEIDRMEAQHDMDIDRSLDY